MAKGRERSGTSIGKRAARAAVVSTVYPAVAPFLGDFIASCRRQIDSDFDLILLNDGFHALESAIDAGELSVRIRAVSGSMAAIRQNAIAGLLAEGDHDRLIFADSDDVMADDRVAVSKALLNDHAIVFNEIMLFGDGVSEPAPLLGMRLKEGAMIGAGDIVESNVLGLSNTAARAEALTRVATRVPDEIQVFDWAYFALLLRSGLEARFTGRTHTRYRQHGANLASPLARSDEQIEFGVRVKTRHYGFLATIDPGFRPFFGKFEALGRKLEADPDFKKWYCSRVRRECPGASPWWEQIQLWEE